MTPEFARGDPVAEREAMPADWDEAMHPNGPPQDYVVSEETQKLIDSKLERMLELARNPPPQVDYYHNDD